MITQCTLVLNQNPIKLKKNLVLMLLLLDNSLFIVVTSIKPIWDFLDRQRNRLIGNSKFDSNISASSDLRKLQNGSNNVCGRILIRDEVNCELVATRWRKGVTKWKQFITKMDEKCWMVTELVAIDIDSNLDHISLGECWLKTLPTFWKLFKLFSESLRTTIVNKFDCIETEKTWKSRQISVSVSEERLSDKLNSFPENKKNGNILIQIQ